MPQTIEADDRPKPPKHKDERLEIRIDPDLAERAREKARAKGWNLSAVLRALLSLWVEEDILDGVDVGQETQRPERRDR